MNWLESTLRWSSGSQIKREINQWILKIWDKLWKDSNLGCQTNRSISLLEFCPELVLILSMMTISNIYRLFKSIPKSILPHPPEHTFSFVYFNLLKFAKKNTLKYANCSLKFPNPTIPTLSMMTLSISVSKKVNSTMFKLQPYFWGLTFKAIARFSVKFLKENWKKFTAWLIEALSIKNH